MKELSSAVVALAGAIIIAGSVGSKYQDAQFSVWVGYFVLIGGLAAWGHSVKDLFFPTT